mgnify:FL=1
MSSDIIIGEVSNPTVARWDTLIFNGYKIVLGISGFNLPEIIVDINDAGVKNIYASATDNNELMLTLSNKNAVWTYHFTKGSANSKLGINEIHKTVTDETLIVKQAPANRTFIISQPKAGTYLCSNLLINFDMIATGMHIKNNKARVYDPTQSQLFDNKTEMKAFMRERRISRPRFGDLIAEIPNHGFAVGHIEPQKKFIGGLSGCKKILLLRPYEEFEESLKRFYGGSSVNRKGYDEIAKWEYQADVFVMKFSDMIKPRIPVINKLQRFLFGEVKFNSEEAITKALASPSLTKSNIR